MRRDQIALQLYTVRELATRDMIGTLRQVAEVGYNAVEFAGFGGVPPDELRAVLDELGMRAASAHVPLEDWTDDPGRVLVDLGVLDCRHAAVPIMAPEHRESEETVARFAQDLNGIAAVCEAAGIGLSYHNHDFEFARLRDATLWEVLVRETDPSLIGLEVDVYWVRYAGVDPEGLLRDVADRVSVLHLKDMAADEERSDAPVGEGTMPWDRLLAAGDAAGVEWYVVEQDHPNDPMQDVWRSLENLERMADG